MDKKKNPKTTPSMLLFLFYWHWCTHRVSWPGFRWPNWNVVKFGGKKNVKANSCGKKIKIKKSVRAQLWELTSKLRIMSESVRGAKTFKAAGGWVRTWEKMRKDRAREREKKRKELDTCNDLNRTWHALCWLLRRSFWNVLWLRAQLDVTHTAPEPHTHFPCCPMALIPAHRREHGHADSLRHPQHPCASSLIVQTSKQGRCSGEKLQTFVMHFTCAVFERSRKQLLLLDMRKT